MGLALRLLFLALVMGGSLLGLLFLLPSLKEGYGIEELPLFAGAATALAAIAAAWWFAHRRRGGRIYVVGLLCLALPLAAYAFLSTRTVFNHWRGIALARSVRVISLREAAIRWPGLPEPIGIRLELEVEHAVGLEGNLYPPKIVMGSNPRPKYADYYSAMDRGIDATLETNIFQPGTKETPRDILSRHGRVLLRYDLFPSSLLRSDGRALCLADRAAAGSGVPAAHSGSDLGASWFFAAAGGVIVDMSDALTDALRRGSALQGRSEEWQRLMRQLDPASIQAQGFRRCAPDHPGSFEVCYCGPRTLGEDPPR